METKCWDTGHAARSQLVNSEEWKQNVGIPAMQARSQLVNSEEWKNTKGVDKLINMEAHYQKNCKHYNLYNALTDTLIREDITPRDFSFYSQSLSKTTKQDYLGKSNGSRNKMIRDGKEAYIGLYVDIIQN